MLEIILDFDVGKDYSKHGFQNTSSANVPNSSTEFPRIVTCLVLVIGIVINIHFSLITSKLV